MKTKKEIKITKQDFDCLYDLADRLHEMIARDYFYCFDRKEAEQVAERLLKELEKNQAEKFVTTPKYKEWKKKWSKQLKEDFKDYKCSACNYLIPQIWSHKNGDCLDCQANYPKGF